VTRDRDFPWWKPQDRSGPSDLRRPRVIRLPISGNRESELGSPGDERSGLSMVETPGQIWTVRFKEATCHLPISGNRGSGIREFLVEVGLSP
jgi:hypothetical protein